ncbi:MAG: LysR family transcriptional regulator [Myxococcales bacterium]|nr:LysR family transcriptional regulator [Myxococcales bacterium]
MPDLSSVDLNLLVSFDLLLDERSVRGAARRAGLSASAMSHTLSRLRDLLGDEVLVRAGRQMVPTPRAEALAVPVKELLARARGVLASAQDFEPRALKRRFRVVCTDHVATVLFTPAEAVFAEGAPGVDLVLAPLTPDTMPDLRSGRVDAAIGVFPEAPPEIRMRRLFADRFVTVCRPDHPRLASVRTLSLAAFLAENHLLVAPRGEPVGLVDRVVEANGHRRRVSRALSSFLAAIWHVSATDALLTVSHRLVRAVAGQLPLKVFVPPVALDDYTMMLAWHPRVDKAVEDRWFRSVLVRAASELEPL